MGQNVLHEVNEAYIGAQMFPGQPYSTPTYEAAHQATTALGPPMGNIIKVEDNRGGIVHVGAEGPNNRSVELYKYDANTGAIVP